MASAGLLLLVAFVIGVVTYFRYIRRYEELRRNRKIRSKKTRDRSKATSLGETIAPSSPSSISMSTSASSSTAVTSSSSSTLRASESTPTSVSTSTTTITSSKTSRFLTSSSSLSASTVTSRAMCDCGSETKSSSRDVVRDFDLGKLLQPTLCIPIEYNQYKPEPNGLLSLIDSVAPSELCDTALRAHRPPKDLGHLTAYKPILHAILYSNTHSKMLNELCDNYAYIENN